MPLPTDPNLTWPPVQIAADILPAMGRWGSWWANDLARLQVAYGGGSLGDPNASGGFFASDQGGLKVHSLGPIRWFVGQAQFGTAQNTKLPIPIAAEICQASADLLFSDPVTITIGKPETKTVDGKPVESPNKTQQRLEDLLDETFHSRLAEAAEAGAALGGVYLRATFDTITHPEGPFTTVVDADMSWPEFDLAGCLSAVTFWTVIAREGKKVYRHLERHEIASTSDRNGIILHGLYEGEEDKLGIRIQLTARAETAPLAAHQDLLMEGTIDTGSPDLAVEYIPNQTPNRMWRHDLIGRNLGRSDLDGIEHLMDQLAETMTDLMRARRAARARVMMAKELVKSSGPGQAATANLDQEVYIETQVARSGGSEKSQLKDLVEVVQPTFEPAGYLATAEALVIRILEMAGYSAQTFGVQPEGGGDRTATEIESKERRSLMTRNRKIRAWAPGLRSHIKKLLAIDNEFFGQANELDDIVVEFADGVQESQIKLGQFVQSLFNGQSASIEERVGILHPDWNDTQVQDEADKIRDEFAAAPMTDPTFPPFGGDTAEVQGAAAAAVSV